ncbi:MAG: WYL domain-containing protein [Alphaproteobacteria bacterium]|nr:WYL domain-containing protein [Alphaproteobacteria bacterium]
MRYGITDRVLQLALAMQGSRLGVSLGDIEHRFRVSRRTAQRMRDAVLRNYPQAEQVEDDERRPRWRVPVAGVVAPGAVSADELADLEAAILLLRRENQRRRAEALEGLLRKIRANLRPELQRRIEPDLEALIEAEGLAMRPGPRPVIRPEVIDTIRLAIKQGRELYLTYYSRHSGKTTGRYVRPYGFIFGSRHYLVGQSPDKADGLPRMFALSGIGKVRVTDRAFRRDPDFSLRRFAERAFAVFQEAPRDIVWRFKPAAAAAAADYVFHPTQSMEPQTDGSLVVRFRAGGLMEMCWHLYTWGDDVEVLAPDELRRLMAKAHRHRGFRVG